VARFTEASKNAVLDRLDAASVVGEYLRLEQKGGRLWGLCPFHHEKTPSFTVDPERKLYYCFGCNKGGTILDFVMEMDKLSFPEAIEKLAKKSGVVLEYEAGGGPAKKDSGHAEELAELLRRVAGSFHHILMNTSEGAAAKKYILGRGITVETVEKFRLGWAPADRSWLWKFLSGKGGFSPEFLASSGLFSKNYPQSAFFSSRLMFPIADRQGRTVAFGGRILPGMDDGKSQKYINSSENEIFKKGRNLYALDLALPEIRAKKQAVLAEGYMDVIALHQAGVASAVAPLGTAFTDEQAKALKRWADSIVLMTDSDEAGQKAAYKGIVTARKAGLGCFVAVPGEILPENAENAEKIKDPAEILQKFGANSLKNAANCGILDFEYLLSRCAKAFRGRAEDKSRAAATFFPYLAALDSEVSRDECMARIAEEAGVDRSSVALDFRRFQSGQQPRYEDAAQEEAPLRPSGELGLMAAVFLNPDFFGELRARVGEDELTDPRAKELYAALEDWWRRRLAGGDGDAEGGSDRRFAELFSALGDAALKGFLLRQSAGGAFDNAERVINDGIAMLKGKSLERRRAEIIRLLRAGAGKEDELLTEKKFIDAELSELKK
jgi:DNA primase